MVPMSSSALALVLVAAVLHIVYGVVLQRGYTVGDLSVVYPVARGAGPLMSVLLAVVLLNERPGLVGLLGAAGQPVISAASFSAADLVKLELIWILPAVMGDITVGAVTARPLTTIASWFCGGVFLARSVVSRPNA